MGILYLSQYYVGFGKLQAIDNKMDSASFYFNEAMNAAKKQGDLRNEYQAYVAEATYLKNISADKKIKLLEHCHGNCKENFLSGRAVERCTRALICL